MLLTYTSDNFTGINNLQSASSGAVLQANNVDFELDKDADSSIYYGFLRKVPAISTIGDTVGTAISLGVYVFVPTNYDSAGNLYIQAFDDGTVRYLDPTSLDPTWTTIFTGTDSSHTRQYDFATYGDTLYFTNGYEAVQKWKAGWTASKNIADLGAKVTTLGTDNWDFAINSSGVDVDADVSSSVEIGDWIQKDDNAPWYGVDDVVVTGGATTIILSSLYLEATDTNVQTVNKATDSLIRARFLSVFKDRMFFASGDTTNIPLVGYLKTYDTDTYTFPEVDPDSPVLQT